MLPANLHTFTLPDLHPNPSYLWCFTYTNIYYGMSHCYLINMQILCKANGFVCA